MNMSVTFQSKENSHGEASSVKLPDLDMRKVTLTVPYRSLLQSNLRFWFGGQVNMSSTSFESCSEGASSFGVEATVENYLPGP